MPRKSRKHTSNQHKEPGARCGRRAPKEAPALPTAEEIGELMRKSRQSVEEIDGILDAAHLNMIERLTKLQGL